MTNLVEYSSAREVLSSFKRVTTSLRSSSDKNDALNNTLTSQAPGCIAVYSRLWTVMDDLLGKEGDNHSEDTFEDENPRPSGQTTDTSHL